MNLLSRFISDKIFEELYKMNIFDERALRNLFISGEYRRLRNLGYSPDDVLLIIQSSFPTIQMDTIRRIACYSKYNKKKEGSMGCYVWPNEKKILDQFKEDEKEEEFDPEDLPEFEEKEEEEEILEPEPEFEE